MLCLFRNLSASALTGKRALGLRVLSWSTAMILPGSLNLNLKKAFACGKLLCSRLVELTGDIAPDMRAVAGADVIITTPEKWDGVSRSWQSRGYVRQVALLIIDEIHLLGEQL